MSKDNVILRAGFDGVHKFLIELCVVAPCFHGIDGFAHDLGLILIHQECDRIQDNCLDLFLAFQLSDCRNNDLRASDFQFRECCFERKIFQISVQVSDRGIVFNFQQ